METGETRGIWEKVDTGGAREEDTGVRTSVNSESGVSRVVGMEGETSSGWSFGGAGVMGSGSAAIVCFEKETNVMWSLT